MLSNLAFAVWMVLLQEGGAGTSWDLRAMWGTMGIIAKVVVFILVGQMCIRDSSERAQRLFIHLARPAGDSKCPVRG